LKFFSSFQFKVGKNFFDTEMGFGIALVVFIVGISGAGINAAGIFYANTKWGEEDYRGKAVWLLIGGLTAMILAIALGAYWIGRHCSLPKGGNPLSALSKTKK
jgi:hypothetical protein